MSKLVILEENPECPECWGTIPHPGDAHCIPDARVELLHKLAYAMMVAELERHMHRTLAAALQVSAEAQRTYKRLLSSREAQKLLEEVEKCGLSLVDESECVERSDALFALTALVEEFNCLPGVQKTSWQECMAAAREFREFVSDGKTLAPRLKLQTPVWIPVIDGEVPRGIDSVICQYRVKAGWLPPVANEPPAGKVFVHEMWCDQGFWAWNSEESEDGAAIADSGLEVLAYMLLPTVQA